MSNTKQTTKLVDMTTCKNCKNCICKMNCKSFSLKTELFKNSKLLTVQVLCTLDKMNHTAEQIHKLFENSQNTEAPQLTKSLLENFLPKLVNEILAYEKTEEKTLSKDDADFVYDQLEDTLKSHTLTQEFENLYNLTDTSDNLYKKSQRWYTKAREKFFRDFEKKL